MSSAADLKDQGNKHFLARKYNDAVGCYSKAIIKNSGMPVYFTNRALCFLKLKKWDEAIKDCKRAVELDSSIVKGHYFLGEAYMEQNMLDEAISNLSKAYDLAKEQKLNFGDDITGAIRKAKRKRWNILEEKRVNQELKLEKYLNNLIHQDQERRKSATDDTAEQDLIEQDCKSKQSELASMFKQLDERRKARDIPEYLCGKISFELMRDPVITPSGITYDRKDLEEHLHRVGHFDPITRTELSTDKLIPNLAMKDVVDFYLQENPWAEDF